MKITEFIQHQVLLPRLHQTGVLVVYDPDQRYRELCQELASDERRVVDASESSRDCVIDICSLAGATPAETA